MMNGSKLKKTSKEQKMKHVCQNVKINNQNQVSKIQEKKPSFEDSRE